MRREVCAETVWERAEPVPCTRTPHDGVIVPVGSLAGVRPPDAGGWLLASGCAAPAGEFTARVLAEPLPHAHGGDVLVRVSAHERHSGPELVRVQVLAVAGGRRVQVAMWETTELFTWPDRVRPAVLFAATALDWLTAQGADIGEDCATRLDADQVICGLLVSGRYRTSRGGI